MGDNVSTGRFGYEVTIDAQAKQIAQLRDENHALREAISAVLIKNFNSGLPSDIQAREILRKAMGLEAKNG